MTDELGNRIKENYENRTRYMLPRRTYTILRLDGAHFHTYTKGLNKPFDHDLSADIDSVIISILPQIQGAVFAYTQSDEISILLTDFALPTTCAWFDGNVQKMCSVAFSIMTAEFNKRRWEREGDRLFGNGVLNPYAMYESSAYFDARVFTIPDRTEVMNYFIWRGNDCSRNSVSMLAQSLFSHKELRGKSTSDMIKMTQEYEHGAYGWESLNDDLKFGRLIVKETYYADMDGGRVGPSGEGMACVERSRWISTRAWRFTDNKEKLLNMIPKYE